MYIYIYYIYIYMYIYAYIYIKTIYKLYIYIYYIYAFLSYGNLEVIFETTFQHLSFSNFISTSSNIYIQGTRFAR